MTSVFSDVPDARPYRCLPALLPLDMKNPPLKSLTGRKLWAARESAGMNWSHPDDVPQQVLNRILWWDSKGYETAYPKISETRKR
jgi:hypothetical protein